MGTIKEENIPTGPDVDVVDIDRDDHDSIDNDIAKDLAEYKKE